MKYGHIPAYQKLIILGLCVLIISTFGAYGLTDINTKLIFRGTMLGLALGFILSGWFWHFTLLSEDAQKAKAEKERILKELHDHIKEQ